MEASFTSDDNKNLIIYRIYPKSFFDSDGDGIGDLKGVTSKLPYLLSLGADVIALSSIFESTSDDAFFAATDFCRINPAIGAMEDYEELVAAAHENGLKVYLSFPLAATSVSHPWFEKSKTKDLNPYREYFTWKPGKSEKGKAAPDSKKNSLKMPVWSYDAKCGEWYRCLLGKYPELNYDNPRLRKEINDVFRFWANKGTDGFIIENAYFTTKKLLLPDQKTLYKVSEELFEEGKDLFRILRDVKEKSEGAFPLFIDTDGVDLKLSPYLLTNADSIVSENLITANRIIAPASFALKSFVKDYLALQNSTCAASTSLSFEDKDHTRLLSKLVSLDDENYLPAAKFLAAMLLCSSATPTIYQGEEIGMTDYTLTKSDARGPEVDPLLLSARSAFQWDNNPHAAFTSAAFSAFPVNENYAKINLLAESSDPNSVFAFYCRMIAFRKASSALSAGFFKDYSDSNLVCFVRESDTERLLFIANPTHKHVNARTPAKLRGEPARCELCNYSVVSKTLNATMGLRPYEVRIFRMKAPVLALN